MKSFWLKLSILTEKPNKTKSAANEKSHTISFQFGTEFIQSEKRQHHNKQMNPREEEKKIKNQWNERIEYLRCKNERQQNNCGKEKGHERAYTICSVRSQPIFIEYNKSNQSSSSNNNTPSDKKRTTAIATSVTVAATVIWSWMAMLLLKERKGIHKNGITESRLWTTRCNISWTKFTHKYIKAFSSRSYFLCFLSRSLCLSFSPLVYFSLIHRLTSRFECMLFDFERVLKAPQLKHFSMSPHFEVSLCVSFFSFLPIFYFVFCLFVDIPISFWASKVFIYVSLSHFVCVCLIKLPTHSHTHQRISFRWKRKQRQKQWWC